MTDESIVSKGFTRVDDHADPGGLVAGMDATSRWPAVRALRDYERVQLALDHGDQVLDVGCGTGDVTVELARLVGPTGRAVGVDASDQMLKAARARAADAGTAATFEVGDASALSFPDNVFDAVRSERTLQWVADPAGAINEMVRVTRPGGRICVTDTDWASLIVEHPSPDVAARFFEALTGLRGDQVTVGRRLVNLLRDAGAAQVTATAQTHVILQWDPDVEPHIPGFFPIRMIAEDFAAQGLISAEDARAAADGLEEAARKDRLFISLTMFAAAGRVPQA